MGKGGCRRQGERRRAWGGGWRGGRHRQGERRRAQGKSSPLLPGGGEARSGEEDPVTAEEGCGEGGPML
ncbi:hypothetical protein PR202_ga28159 [Eleusine coracana subsp. coracana]|uniref:Uncharacterized protein n=1 Tax=Eleusine coracana subsp. coracana TaxID=191504 RepID=A0AAV5DIR4_ELECO|nr:hypothetical protein PR202_ga28159 [Eleusine coracana subsp. coracana]